MFGSESCEATIPLLQALLSGTDGACIDLGMASVIALVAGFMAAVIALQFVGKQLLRLVFRRPAKSPRAPRAPLDSPLTDGSGEPAYDDGPIRSAGPR